MKTYSSRLGALIALLGLLIVPAAVLAVDIRSGDAPTLTSGSTITDDLYMVGGSVTSSGVVKGDLVTGGGNVLINGLVAADLIVAGGNISIVSDVGDDVRAAGGTVVLQGSVGGDVVVGGGQVTISGARVGGDVAAAGGVVRIDSPVVGDVQVVGGDIYIDSTIGGNLDIQAEKITFGPKAVVSGNFTYKAPKEVVMTDGAVVLGTKKYTPAADIRETAKLGFAAFLSIWAISKLLMIFAGALIIGYVFPRYASELVARSTARPLNELGRGLIFVIVTPVLSIMLLFTVIGIAFGVLGLLSYAALLIYGAMITPVIVGSVADKIVFKRSEYEINWKTILGGTLMYFALGFIPVLGWVVGMAAMLIALGAAINIKSQILSEWR